MTTTRRRFLFAAGAAPLIAGESWEESAFPNWTPETVDRLLTDSPWAKPLRVPFEFQPPPRQLQSGFGDIEIPAGTPGSSIPRGGAGRSPRTARTGPGGGRYPVHTEVYLTIRWSSALPIRQALALERRTRDGLDDPKVREFLERRETHYVLEVFGLPVRMVPQGTRRLEAELLGSAQLWMKGHLPIRATSVSVPE